MDIVLLCFLSMAAGVGLGWWLRREPAEPVMHAAPAPREAPFGLDPLPVVAEEAPEVIEPFPPPPPAQERVTLILTSEFGERLGRVSVRKSHRRPTLTFQPRGVSTPCQFVADRQVDGGFLYRQVGRDRE